MFGGFSVEPFNEPTGATFDTCLRVIETALGSAATHTRRGTRPLSYATLTFSGCVWNRWYNSSGEIL